MRSDNCVESGGLQSGSCTCSKFTQYNVCVLIFLMGSLVFTFDYNLFDLTVEYCLSMKHNKEDNGYNCEYDNDTDDKAYNN